MAIAVAQFIWVDVNTSASSTAISTGTTYNALFNNQGAGNTNVIYSFSNFGSQTSITDTQGNTYNLRNTASSAAGPGNQKLYRYVAKNIVGGANTITLNLPSAQTIRPILLVEFSGCSTTPEDGSSANDQNPPAAGTDNVTSNGATNTNQPAMVEGFTLPIFSGTPPATGTGFVSTGTPWSGSGSTGNHETKRITSTGSFAATWTRAFAVEHLSIVGILDESGGVVSATNQSLMMRGIG